MQNTRQYISTKSQQQKRCLLTSDTTLFNGLDGPIYNVEFLTSYRSQQETKLGHNSDNRSTLMTLPTLNVNIQPTVSHHMCLIWSQFTALYKRALIVWLINHYAKAAHNDEPVNTWRPCIRSGSVAGQNGLPASVRTATSLSTFRQQLHEDRPLYNTIQYKANLYSAVSRRRIGGACLSTVFLLNFHPGTSPF